MFKQSNKRRKEEKQNKVNWNQLKPDQIIRIQSENYGPGLMENMTKSL